MWWPDPQFLEADTVGCRYAVLILATVALALLVVGVAIGSYLADSAGVCAHVRAGGGP